MQNNTEITIIETEIEKFVDIVAIQPANIVFDFEKLEEKIKDMVGSINIHFDTNNNIDNTKTNFIVNYDNRIQSKKTYQFLNSVKKNIATKMKMKIQEAIAPIEIFKENIKKTDLLIDNAVFFISTQTKAHEEQLKLVCKELLLEYFDKLCLQNNLLPEYKEKIDISDLAILTNINTTSAEIYITKQAKDSVEARVNKMLLLQSKIKDRLSSLKDICLTAGLITPITKEDILHVLESENDNFYNECIASLIKKELDKQNTITKVIEQKKAEPVVEIKKDVVLPTNKTKQLQNTKYYISAIFEIETNIDEVKLKTQYESKIKEIFKNTFKNLTIQII